MDLPDTCSLRINTSITCRLQNVFVVIFVFTRVANSYEYSETFVFHFLLRALISVDQQGQPLDKLNLEINFGDGKEPCLLLLQAGLHERANKD